MKKYVSLLLAVLMLLALGSTAFAASSDADKKGSIKILNTSAFDPAGTYSAYKIFDVTYADGTKDDGAYSYTISSTSPWKTTVESYFTLEASAADETVLTATPKTGYSAATFAAALKTAYDAMTPKPTGAVTLAGAGTEELALGYWFVTTTTGTLCNLTTTHPNSEIRDKNEPTPFDKKETSTEITGSVQLGDIIPYEVTGKVPSTTGYTQYIYEVSDTLTGAKFNKNVVVKFGSTTITPATGELTQTDTGFTLKFDMTKHQAYVGQDISITYSATVDGSSLTTGAVKNKATLKNSHDPANPTDQKTEPSVEVIHKTFTIDLTKVASDGSTKLKDAQFILQNKDSKYYKYDAANNKVTWVEAKENATVVTTLDTGKGDTQFKGLKAGKYSLVETKAPYGYNLPKAPFVIEIIESDEPEVSGTSPIIKEYTYTAKVDSKSVDVTDICAVVTTIKNNAGALLPETGSTGTTMLLAVGSVLFVFTAVILVTKKRMYNQG